MAESKCTKCGRGPVTARGLCHKHWQAHRNRQIAYGKWAPGSVDIGPTLEHFAKLQAAGLGVVRIAQLSGLPKRTVRELRRPNRKKCFPATAEAILSIPIPHSPHGDELAPGAMIPSLGTARRLQSLARSGFGVQHLAEELGMKFQYVHELRRPKAEKVTAATARKVDAVWRRLQLQQGPSKRVAELARASGWPPPFAWDEETIDDPNACPNKGLIIRNKTPWLDSYWELKEMGKTDRQIAERLNIRYETMRDTLRRHARAA